MALPEHQKFRPCPRQLGPSIATWAHFLCGLVGLTLAVHGMHYAAWISLALFFSWQFDLLDGKWARVALRNDSEEEKKLLAEYGDKLDSIVDGINFALLPTWLGGWCFYRAGAPIAVVGIVAVSGFLYTISVHYRLARSHFLLRTSGTVWFWGLPCMAPAMLLAALVPLLVHYVFPTSAWLAGLVLSLSYLTLGRLCISTTVKYSHNKAWVGPLTGELVSLVCLAGLTALALQLSVRPPLNDTMLACWASFWLGYVVSPVVHKVRGTYERVT